MAEYAMTITDNFTPTPASDPKSYSPDVINRDLDILAAEVERLKLDSGSFRRQLIERDAQIASVKDVILEAFDVDEFDKDVVKSIAEALEIELTKVVDITARAFFSGTVTVPLGFDVENDLETYIEFEAALNARLGYEDVECDLWSDGVEITVTN